MRNIIRKTGKLRMDTFIIFLLLFLAVGSGESLAQGMPKRGGTVNVGINSDVPTVDPHRTSAHVANLVLSHIFEPLVGYGDGLEIVPVLAERWEMSRDLKTYTFYLRKGKLFHNGREMVGEDVKYSIERIMDPKTGNPRRSEFSQVDKIEVINNYTVRFHMKKGDVGFLHALASFSNLVGIVPKEEVIKQGGAMKHPVGTGPFKFVEWKPDRYILVERFDKYKPQPGPVNGAGGERIAYLDKVKFIPVPEESVAEMALLNKEIDFLLYVPFKDIERLKKEYGKRGLVVDQKPGLSWFQIFFGCNQPVTKDVKFRRACAYAIDRDMVAAAATRGYSVVNPSVITQNSEYYTPKHQKWYPKDVGKAKQLLKECGYQGEEVSILTNKKIVMMYDQALPIHSELNAVGIKAKLEVVDWPVELNRFYAGNFQIISYGIGPSAEPGAAYGYFMRTGFGDQYPRMKQILDEASQTLDVGVRKKLFEEAHDLVIDGVPGINFYNYYYTNAYWSYLKNFKISSSNQAKFWGVWLEK